MCCVEGWIWRTIVGGRKEDDEEEGGEGRAGAYVGQRFGFAMFCKENRARSLNLDTVK